MGIREQEYRKKIYDMAIVVGVINGYYNSNILGQNNSKKK